MRQDWDVVVVGSGLGGLACAAYLCAAGQRTLVLESHSVAGGNSQVFRRTVRGSEYEFDVGIHYIGECGPDGLITRILNGVGLAERIVFRPLDPDGFSTLVFPDLRFRVPVGWDRYRARLLETFPDEAEPLGRVVDLMREIGEQGRRLQNQEIGMAELFASAPNVAQWGLRPITELVRGARALAARAGGAARRAGRLRGAAVEDARGARGRSHRSLHARRLLSRGRRPGDGGAADRGDPRLRRRGARARRGRAHRRGRRPRARRRAGEGRRAHRRAGRGLERGPEAHRARAGRRRTLRARVGRARARLPHVAAALRRLPRSRRGSGCTRRPQHQLLDLGQLRPRGRLRGAGERQDDFDAARLRDRGVAEGSRPIRTSHRAATPISRS